MPTIIFPKTDMYKSTPLSTRCGASMSPALTFNPHKEASIIILNLQMRKQAQRL